MSQLEYSGRLDSEYYRPSYLKSENLLRKRGSSLLSKVAEFKIGPFGSAFNTDNYTDDRTYRYIRGKDVKHMRLMDNDNVYVPELDFLRLQKYSLKEDDVLISVVGTIGNAAIIQQHDIPAIFSCKSTVVRSKKINPRYLLSFLNSKYGRTLLQRKERGAIQKGLNLDDLKTLDVFLASNDFQKKIEQIFLSSALLTEKTKNIYLTAENLLLSTLGMTNFSPRTETINIQSFKNSFASTKRLDAEYYQPKYEQMMSHITARPHARLTELVDIQKSLEPGSDAYTDDEDGLPFLRIADYSKFGLTKPQKRLNATFVADNSDKLSALMPKKNTILFSKDGSVGEAYRLREDADFITSGAVLHLTVKDEQSVLPDYLTLALNSILVRTQAERDAGGSIILHWRIDEIKNVVVPLVDMAIQQKIAAALQDSFTLKAESERLLEVAKRAVEIAIEQDETAATTYIEENSSTSIAGVLCDKECTPPSGKPVLYETGHTRNPATFAADLNNQ